MKTLSVSLLAVLASAIVMVPAAGFAQAGAKPAPPPAQPSPSAPAPSASAAAPAPAPPPAEEAAADAASSTSTKTREEANDPRSLKPFRDHPISLKPLEQQGEAGQSGRSD